MAVIKWDEDTKRFYETGTSHGVLYLKNDDGSYSNGVPWNGLTGVGEKPSGADETELFADDVKYGSLRAAEKFGASIEAYTYPDEFEECDGSHSFIPGVTIGQQPRRAFGFTYQTVVGNDVSTEAGFKLHIIYNATASPSEKSYKTISDSPEAITFSWEVATTPTEATVGGKTYRSATFIVDTTKLADGVNDAKLKALMDKLYGTSSAEPTLPSLQEVIEMFKTA